MEAFALSKFNRISPKKLRRVALAINHLYFQEALDILTNLPQKGAVVLYKTLKSAGANLQNKDPESREDEWIIREITVNQGPSLKRVKSRAKGKADRICRPTSHLKIVLAEE
ncbi:MAG: 50S ribosomal protein L22 [Spirochaetota bacterium]|nr:50S ribosomal protein L22 [Spirochaetota bacterium]